ncbi:bifunctional indole-3-glycerol phosphate synthase/phosphoribosylanthranilate isomerase [uncultured Treponema sp.]|uniref:bifunctional indole-3-glycerol phosphate synthase/phosphoribosylanthranilate isomerase n=1 Tax=uncultured Treponema sp. TaxID=162155 RepID=UPI0025D09CEF|nr:bifunctional indole-3-glycerol phosphate synthase/phosphoribosylanthranilate isomerase [uncultured Treponema sp.]
MNILEEIVEQRKKDIAEKGVSLGFEVPQNRTRGITPFLPQKGVILEIKRASPSKGDIAPDLDAAKTAELYAKAGTSAISVLTEEHWFKGNLQDLQNACRAVDEYASKTQTNPPAILRKDFLISEDEIDIAFRCGADAVLLIARILDTNKIVSMAKKCEQLGISALIELRLDEDLKKLSEVVKHVDTKFIVCGVNARDLKNFSIDLLTPLALLSEIRSIAGKDARVVFESGIRTNEAAEFAGSLGFSAMLLGEAAARNPQKAGELVSSFVNAKETENAHAWNDFANKLQAKRKSCETKPFIKICGITNEKDAVKAAELGADFLGFIFFKKSPRKINPANLPEIVQKLQELGLRQKVRLVGVIVDTDSKDAEKAFEAQKAGLLDFIQLHGCGHLFTKKELPHYAVVNISSEKDLQKLDELRLKGEPRILIDAKIGNQLGGTGERISDLLVEKVSQKTKLWLAGGITSENISEIINKFHPELLDIASGVESEPGIKDHKKLEAVLAKNY